MDVFAFASQDQMKLQGQVLLSTTLVQDGPATVALGMHRFGCHPLFHSLPIAFPDPTPDDHHCLKPLPCPRCKNSSSMDESGPLASTLSAVQKLPQFPPWKSVNVMAPISHPEPPHVCKEIPCPHCGRRMP